jgi:hypothetical protein
MADSRYLRAGSRLVGLAGGYHTEDLQLAEMKR